MLLHQEVAVECGCPSTLEDVGLGVEGEWSLPALPLAWILESADGSAVMPSTWIEGSMPTMLEEDVSTGCEAGLSWSLGVVARRRCSM